MGSTEFPLALVASPQHIFPGILEGTSHENLVRNLLKRQDPEKILRYCALISLYLWNHADPSTETNLDKRIKERQLRIACLLPFTDETRTRIADFLTGDSRTYGAPRSGIPKLSFTRGQVLEFVRQLAINRENFIKNPAPSEDDLLKLLLLCGEKHYEGLTFEIQDNQILKFIESIEAGSHGIPVIGGIGRAKNLMKDRFLQLMDGSQNLGQTFENRTGLPFNWYVLCGIACMLMLISKRASGENPSFTLSDVCEHIPDLVPYLQKFMDLLSQTPNELFSNATPGIPIESDRFFATHSFRNKPLIRFSNGTFAIIDPVAFMESFLTGTIFRLFDPGNESDAKRFIAYFGDAFEEYCASILKDIFPSIPGLADRTKFNVKLTGSSGEKAEIDGLIYYEDTLIVIESKTGFIPDVSRSLGKNFLEVVRKKFVEGKGIDQLHRNIKIILENIVMGSKLFTGIIKIIPILLTYHSELGAPLINKWFSEEFTKKLASDTLKGFWMQKGDYRVSNPVVMTLDDLEGLENSLKDISMKEILIEYLKAFQGNPILSFHGFLQMDARYGARLRANERLKVAWDQEFARFRRLVIE